MARVGVLPGAGGPAGINDPTVEFHTNCIADKCAMWRWAAKPSDHQPTIDLDQNLDILGLNTRTKHCLYQSDIRTLRKLVVLSVTKLKTFPNFGTKSAEEIKTALANIGLGLSMPKEMAVTPGSGYCGLAGRPEA